MGTRARGPLSPLGAVRDADVAQPQPRRCRRASRGSTARHSRTDSGARSRCGTRSCRTSTRRRRTRPRGACRCCARCSSSTPRIPARGCRGRVLLRQRHAGRAAVRDRHAPAVTSICRPGTGSTTRPAGCTRGLARDPGGHDSDRHAGQGRRRDPAHRPRAVDRIPGLVEARGQRLCRVPRRGRPAWSRFRTGSCSSSHWPGAGPPSCSKMRRLPGR